MRRLVALAAVWMVTACSPRYVDGLEVEGRWVSFESVSVADCSRPRCAELVEVARRRLLEGEPRAVVTDVRLHAVPHELNDGSVTAVTLPVTNIVFTLADGTRRLESFQCDLHGGVTDGSLPIYEPFC